MNCYNCGKPLKKKDNHVEHIPAKNLYEEFPHGHKTNRITVPACYDCNQSYHDVDEEFRNFIGTINKRPAAIGLVKKTTRSIARSKSKTARVLYSVKAKQPIAVKFDMKEIQRYHAKNFKGVFYHNYGFHLTDDYKIVVHCDETDKRPSGTRLLNYLQNNFKMKVSGHEDVFRYIIQPFRTNYKFDGNDIEPEDNDRFVALLSYTKNHAALVVAEKQK